MRYSDIDRNMAWINEFAFKEKVFPKSHKTLLSMPPTAPLKKLSYGQIGHIPLDQQLYSHLKTSPFLDVTAIKLQISVDGVSFFKNSKEHAVVLAGAISCPVESEPFLISFFYGESTKLSSQTMFSEFIDDLKQMKEFGLRHPITNKDVSVKVRQYSTFE